MLRLTRIQITNQKLDCKLLSGWARENFEYVGISPSKVGRDSSLWSKQSCSFLFKAMLWEFSNTRRYAIPYFGP